MELDYLTGTAKLQHMIDDLRQRARTAELLSEAAVAADLSTRAGRLEALLPVTRADYGMVQSELLDIAIDSCGDMAVASEPDEFINEAPPRVLQQWIAAKQSGLFDHFTLYLVAEIPDRDDEFLRIHGGYVLGHRGDHCFWVTSWW